MTEQPVLLSDAAHGSTEFAARQAALAFLIGTVRLDGKGGNAAALSPAAWSCVAEQAVQQKIGALAYHRVANGPEGALVPDPVRNRLRTLYALGQLRNTLLLRDAGQVIDVLHAAGIPVMVLKGLHLATQVYAEPALRTMSDIDVMVHERDLAEAEAALVREGFGPQPRPDIRDFCRRSNHLARLTRPKTVPVEVHWTIERPTSPFSIDVEGLWRRAQPVSIDGVEALALSAEDLILHLCLHTSYHHRFDRTALKGLVDIDAVVAASNGRIDWHGLARTAGAWKAGPYVYATLHLATAILGTPVPPAVLGTLGRKPGDDDLVELVRRFILTPMIDLPQGYRDIRDPDTWWHRVGNVVRSIFLPKDQIRRLYNVREGSPVVYLFYGVRVVDLLVRRGKLGLQLVLGTRQVRPALFREAARSRIDAWVGRAPPDPPEEGALN